MTLEHLILPTRQTRNIDLFLEVCFWSDIQVTRLAPGEEDQLPLGATLNNTTVLGGPAFCRWVADGASDRHRLVGQGCPMKSLNGRVALVTDEAHGIGAEGCLKCKE